MANAQHFHRKLFLICLFQFLIFMRTIENNEKFDSIPKKVVCKIHSDLVENFTCAYKPLGWKKASYSFDGSLKNNFQIYDAIFKGTLYRRGTNLEFRIFGPKEMVLNVCGFLNGTYTDVIVDWMAKYLKKVSRETNIIHACPLSGHLYVHELIMDENTYSIVDLLPDGEFQSKTLVYTKFKGKEHLLVEVTMGVHIKSKGIFERF